MSTELKSRGCCIEGCDRPFHAKEMCSAHYTRQWRFGDPLAGGALKPFGASPEELFWSKVEKTDSCWLWRGALTTAGYGSLSIRGVKSYAHRVAYEEVNPPVPAGMYLDHLITCPKNCVRPDHLRVATPKQNGENRGHLNKNNTSGVRGVSWDSSSQRWTAKVMHKRKTYHLGSFLDIEDAKTVVIKKRNELFTHNDEDRTWC